MNQLSTVFIHNIKQIIEDAQQHAVRAVNQQRVHMYWHIGKHIAIEEQKEKKRADYGTFLIKTLAKELTKDLESALISNMQTVLLELGNGFSFVARRKRIQLEDENPTIGILLCTDKNNTMVEYAFTRRKF